jgi:hypothetical protein
MSSELVRAGAADGDECRCVCGSLVARVVADGVELKCRRCKRKLLVAVPLANRLRPGSALRVRAASETG